MGHVRNLIIAQSQQNAQVEIARVRTAALEAVDGTRFTPRDTQVLRVCISVCADLASHGWELQEGREGIFALPPRHASSANDEKQRVRDAHLIERDQQLALPATRRFIAEMERRRPTRDGWRSIFTLMRDGRSLSEYLKRASSDTTAEGCAATLRTCISPYVQVVEPEAIDHVTGLRLMDIWRYFRHTWTTAYNSTPGRKMYVLIRDRAVPEHPVIGIAALGSAIVQMADRDNWIGWSSSAFLARLLDEPTADWARWLLRSLDKLLDALYVADLVSDHIIARKDLSQPTEEAIERLRKEALAARTRHRLYSQASQHKATAVAKGSVKARGGVSSRPDHGKGDEPHWRELARTHLFRSKRAATLADLLEVRRRFLRAGFASPTGRALAALLASSDGRRAVQTVLRHVRGVHVGVDMLDITVCGSVAPYNTVLGGKLVSMLMATPEVVSAYASRYRAASSVIASSMAGRAVNRRPQLVLLCTTSLYGVAASQYNRIRIPAEAIGALADVQYVRLGRTAGFGSYQFSRETLAELEAVSAGTRRGREVNSIFGEGVNPKLRKVRGALTSVGLPADRLLQHGSPRLIYGIPLAVNFREVLLGRSNRPQYVLPNPPDGVAVDAIAEFWRKRWLQPRIRQADVLAGVAEHSLAHPVSHGARVQRLPEDAEVTLDSLDLFPNNPLD